jgi:hypothetical protein
MASARHPDDRSFARRCAIAWACAAAMAPALADAAGTRVYRCQDGARVTYSDQPCANARVLDVDGGAAAPDAAERLRRDQQALDTRAAQLREMRARDEAMARMNVVQAAPPPPDDGSQAYYADYPGYGYGVWDPTKPRGQERRQERRDDRRNERDQRRQNHIVVRPPPHPSLLR